MKRDRWLMQTFLGTVATLTASLVPPLITPALAQTPEVALPADLPRQLVTCLQTGEPFQIAKVEIISQTQYDARDYYLVGLFRADTLQTLPNYFIQQVVSVDEGGCIVEYYNPQGYDVPLSAELPQAVANELTLGQHEWHIAQIGREEFQRRMTRFFLERGPTSLRPEERWSLEQLGFQIPWSLD